MRSGRRFAALIVALLVVCFATVGCGVTTGGQTTTTGAGSKSDPPKGKKDQKDSAAKSSLQTSTTALSTRPPSLLIMDGFTDGTLAETAYQRYQNQGGSETVSIESDNQATAFQRLCAGQVDIVNSVVPMDRKDVARCQHNGVTPVQIQLASDATVLATENETDVGADCLTLPQVRAILRAGSVVNNWNQLGFDDAHLSVGGQSPSTPEFQFFGSLLTDSDNPSINDLRDDYHLFLTQDGVRHFIIGSFRQGELANYQLTQYLVDIHTIDAYIAGQQAVVRGADQWIRSSKRYNKPVQLLEARAKRDNALRQLRILYAKRARFHAIVVRKDLLRNGAEASLGRVGLFQYGYYALYEQQLRPLEITESATHENCVFPSTDTITNGDYPLAQRMLVTFSLQELKRNDGLRAFLLSYLRNVNTLASGDQLVPLPIDILDGEERYLAGHTLTVTTSTSTPQPGPAAGEQTSMSGTGGATTVTSQSTTTTSSSAGFGAKTTSSSANSGVPQGVH